MSKEDGEKPRGKRAIDGVLLLDKPVGWSSSAALGKARWLLQAAKAGHTGTLDPFADGLLPLCFGEATKFSRFLLAADKIYLATLKLGERTATADIEGEVIERRPVRVGHTDVERVLPRFLGDILQIPPMHSALKRDGRPLYEYARRGEVLERPARPVVIYAIDLITLAGDILVLRVRCGKGVYIRTLAEDIGAALGCGAHLQALRREAVAGFRVEDAVTLAQIEAREDSSRAALLLPVDTLIGDLPRIDLDPESAWQLSHGQSIWRAGLVQDAISRVYDPTGRLIGVCQVNAEGKLAPLRLMNTVPGTMQDKADA